ncbi:hypothetical protein BDV12DRAFT_203346 [Aspergillus spectabilis]
MAASTVTAAPTKRALGLSITPVPRLIDSLTDTLGLDLNLAVFPDALDLSEIDLSELKIRKLLDCILDELSIDVGVSVSAPTTATKRSEVLGLDLRETPLAQLVDVLANKLGIDVGLSVLPNGLSDLSNVSLEGVQTCLAGAPPTSTSTSVITPTQAPISTPVISVPAVPASTSVSVTVPLVQPSATHPAGCKARY